MTKANDINILLITADQLRADSLSAAGHPLVETPHIDALADQGTMFTHHFSQCTPCGPARTSLLTGMYQMNHRSVQNGVPLDAAFTNLAQETRAAGLEPWLIGYTDTTLDPRSLHPRDPRTRRYEEILPGMMQYAPGSEWGTGDTDWRNRLRELGYENWNDPYRQRDVPGAQERGPSYAPITIKAEHSDTAYTADRAIRFIGQNRGRGWFLHTSFLRPHPPFVAPEPWHDRYRLEDVPDFAALPTLEDERRFHPIMPYRLERLEQNPRLPQDMPPNDNLAWRQARATYYGLISELDANIGRILAALKESGELERTLVIVTSDHGEMLGDHWCWGKQTPFDQAVRVPLIVKAPGSDPAVAGRRVDAFTEHVDLMPTILDYLGVEKPLQCDGASLRPFAEGGTPARWRGEARWEHDFRSVAKGDAERAFGITLDECSLSVVRTRGAKYVHFAGLPPMYFDLTTDPHELTNLADAPERASEVLAMAQRMLNWRIAYNRRELTGCMVTDDGEQLTAERHRRIV